MSDQKLPAASRFMALQYKLYDNWRHRRAYDVARERGNATDLTGFRGSRYCLLVTFKRSGEGVPTPVNFGLAEDGSKLYFRSESHVLKMKRIARDPHVRVCPCGVRGKPRGPAVEARARVLPAEEDAIAYGALEANWGWDLKPVEKGYDRIGVPFSYVEVTPA